MKKAIVTGASGFIGSELCNYLTENGVLVYAVLRSEGSYLEQFRDNDLIIPIYCDMENVVSLYRKITEEADVFYHLAWAGISGKDRENYKLQLQSIKWTMDAVTVADKLGCKRFVGAGTLAEIDVNNYSSLDGSTPNLASEYGAAKISAHYMSKALCNSLHIDHLWGIISNAYGENDKSTNFINFASDLIVSDKSADFTDGEQWYDFVHVHDVAKGLYCIGENGKSNYSYYIGSGYSRKLKDFIIEMRDILKPGKQLNLGAVPFNGISSSIETFDCSKLMEHTGYLSQISFAEGIKKIKEKRGWKNDKNGKF